ncbi:MAG: type VI secretion system lipoprotein TssJ [Gemmatimonadetes bacterium]|nr:type VI secretion system lipoprotein TssJ [Gemmatimonadota bacterium]
MRLSNRASRRFPAISWRGILPGLALLLGAACAPQLSVYTGEKIHYLDVIVTGTPELNRGEDGEAHPVILRLYELTSATNFQRSIPTALWEDDDRALGDEYIDKQVLILQPGEEQRLQMGLNAATKFVGVAANFSRPDAAGRWREVYPVSPRSRQLRVVVREDQLAIQGR